MRTRCAAKLSTPRGREAVYLAVDFAQFNGFCFLNHPCWAEAGFFGQLLSRSFALSHLQFSVVRATQSISREMNYLSSR